jgi:hypothetical protein
VPSHGGLFDTGIRAIPNMETPRVNSPALKEIRGLAPGSPEVQCLPRYRTAVGPGEGWRGARSGDF